jgi:hypothetical protein
MDGPMTAYRVVVSREDPWWVATAYGDGLPEHGAVTESRTIAGLEDEIRDLIVLRTDADLRMPYKQAAHSFGLDWEYDLPLDAEKKLMQYRESKLKLTEAQAVYADRAQKAAIALAAALNASIRDIARLMEISFQRVQQLLAHNRHRAGR